ncbi:MAG: hypothetical protein ACRC40_03170 [Fusobacteriaceae bacterium]
MSITSIKGEERLQNLEARLGELKIEYAEAVQSLESKKEAIYLKKSKELDKLIKDVEDEINEMVMR